MILTKSREFTGSDAGFRHLLVTNPGQQPSPCCTAPASRATGAGRKAQEHLRFKLTQMTRRGAFSRGAGQDRRKIHRRVCCLNREIGQYRRDAYSLPRAPLTPSPQI